MQVIIAGATDRETVQAIAQRVAVPVHADPAVPAQRGAFPLDLNLASAVAGIIGGVISLYQLWKSQHDSTIWSRDNILKRVAEEMMKHGVVDYEPVEIKNVESLAGPSANPCTVTVHDTRKNRWYDIIIHSDGETLTLTLR